MGFVSETQRALAKGDSPNGTRTAVTQDGISLLTETKY